MMEKQRARLDERRGKLKLRKQSLDRYSVNNLTIILQFCRYRHHRHRRCRRRFDIHRAADRRRHANARAAD